VGIFKRNITKTYAERAAASTALAISTPWNPQTTLESFAKDALKGVLVDGANHTITREDALRIPGIKRAHGIICTQFAAIPFFQMDDDVKDTEQPRWLTTSDSGVAPYHRNFGAASDWFFNGWACFGFTDDMTDCLHIPFGLWFIDINGDRGEKGLVYCDSDDVEDKYKAQLIAVPLGFGENGVLVDGKDTINQARKIEEAYLNRLDNPIPLTVLTLRDDIYFSMEKDKRAELRDEWDEGRRKNSTALKPEAMKVDLPGATVGTDLYETGRNAVRLDIANHVSLPASVLEGVRQGGSGGGTEMRYTGVQNGNTRSELWDFGLAKRMVLAFEARMSLDDIVPSGKSIRGDLSNMLATPDPTTTPTSKD
jgi:hypothetical protein